MWTLMRFKIVPDRFRDESFDIIDLATKRIFRCLNGKFTSEEAVCIQSALEDLFYNDNDPFKILARLLEKKHKIDDIKKISRKRSYVQARIEFTHKALRAKKKQVDIAKYLGMDHSQIHYYQYTYDEFGNPI